MKPYQLVRLLVIMKPYQPVMKAYQLGFVDIYLSFISSPDETHCLQRLFELKRSSDFKWNIAKDARKIVNTLYRSRKYLPLSTMPNLYQRQNWWTTIIPGLDLPYSYFPAFTPPYGWCIIFHIIFQAVCSLPDSILPLFSWQMPRRATSLSRTKSHPFTVRTTVPRTQDRLIFTPFVKSKYPLVMFFQELLICEKDSRVDSYSITVILILIH